MSVYMTEEEQLEAIKKFWKKHQNKITVLLSGVLLVTAGFRYWNWHIEKRDHNASIVYEQLIHAFTKENAPAIQAYSKTLTSNYQHTVYADAALLVLAKTFVEAKEWSQAIGALKQVAEKGQTAALRDVAKFRLARIFLYRKQYDEALKILNEVHVVDETKLHQLKNDVYSAKKLS